MPGHSLQLGDLPVQLEVTDYAPQASGSVLVSAGRAVLLGTFVVGEQVADRGFLPLTVDYRERAASHGRIPGGYQRREMRMSDREVLIARRIDRCTRSLLHALMRSELHLMVTVLSADTELDLFPLAVLAASGAVQASGVPWAGPVVVWSERPDKRSKLDEDMGLDAAFSPAGLVALQGAFSEITEDELQVRLKSAQRDLDDVLSGLQGIESGRSQGTGTEEPPGTFSESDVSEASQVLGKVRAGSTALERKETLARHLSGGDASTKMCRDAAFGVSLRRELLAGQARLDGRDPEALRPLDLRVSWLPTPHGSALYRRGHTLASVTCAIGGRGKEQTLDSEVGTVKRRMMLHYNFPGFAVGEVRPNRGPGRRELGHGELARSAFFAVLPDAKSYPSVIRIEADILESDGSSSMATVGGATLAMLDAGVPLKAPVGGVAMGLVREGDNSRVLSDITEEEDHYGDVDCKLAGTRAGLTAVQMDTRAEPLKEQDWKHLFAAGHAARLAILDRLDEVLASPRASAPGSAPLVHQIQISPQTVGLLIGPKGAHIKSIQSDCDVDISVNDAGEVSILAQDQDGLDGAVARVRDLTGAPMVHEILDGTILTVTDSGMALKLYESAEAWMHVSEWEEARTENLQGVAKVGDQITVKVLGPDERGRIRVSRRQAVSGS